MLTEIKIQKNYLHGERINTIYFGGGTPSLVGPAHLDRLLNSIYRVHDVVPDVEITVEANPDDLRAQQARDLFSLGVNRLSIGIQSFKDSFLHVLHRAHNASDALLAFDAARKAGFENISADLIFGMPHSSVADFEQDLQQMCLLRPEHVSVYALTIEPRTVFGHRMHKDQLALPDEDIVADQFNAAMDHLISAGYQHYEISNYALPGYRSQHNTSYWDHSTYLGIGPGAHSFDGRQRAYNVANNHLYRKAIVAGKIPATAEWLTKVQLANEYIMLSLRTAKGFDAQRLMRQYGMEMTEKQNREIGKYLNNGCIERRGTAIVCTDRGKLLADQITLDLCFE